MLYEAKSADNDVTTEPSINPYFLPTTLIIKEAKILPNAVPTIIKAGGKVAKDFSRTIDDPIIPLIKTVMDPAVKENI